jgi:hypothetical protein
MFSKSIRVVIALLMLSALTTGCGIFFRHHRHHVSETVLVP